MLLPVIEAAVRADRVVFPPPVLLNDPLALAAATVALVFEAGVEDEQTPTVLTTSWPGRHGTPPSVWI